MDQIEEVKQKVDIVQLVSEYVPLKKAGRNFKGVCPFHGEKTPSFMVNPELQIFKCFGCNEGGDAYAFLQKIEGMTFGEALQNLAKRVGITLTSYKPNEGEQIRERFYAMHNLLADAYHFLLTKHAVGKATVEYLKSRKISDESVEKFKLGYVPERWDFAVEFLTKKKGYKLEELQQAGLAVKTYDRFRNRIMFPLANGRGQVVGFAGRVMPGADEKAGGKYINSPETEIYHKGDMLYGFDLTRPEIKKEGYAVVVEGEIDAIASWQAGVKNVVALKGTAFTPRQVELLRRVSDTVVLAFDADVAGDAAARRGIQLADRGGLSVKMARWEGGKDPGELATSDPEAWKRVVREAIPVYDFYLQSAVERYGLEAAGKKKIGEELLPIWAEISDEIVRAHYIGRLASELGVREEDVRAQMQKNPRDPSAAVGMTKREEQKATEREVRERRVVQLAVLGEKYKELEGEIKRMRSDFWVKAAKAVAEGGFEAVPVEMKQRVAELTLTEEEYNQKNWEEAVRLLELLNIEEELKTKEEDDQEVVRLSRRKAELTKGK